MVPLPVPVAEVRGEPDATRLVRDICSRPELAPLQIDFCVVVK